MARYIGPKSKIARRFGEAIFGADKVLSKRNFPPGQHGNNRRRKMSEYGVMLAEKQKAKYTYGVLERQFRNMFEKAAKADGITGEVLLQNLECRLFVRNQSRSRLSKLHLQVSITVNTLGLSGTIMQSVVSSCISLSVPTSLRILRNS